MLIPDASAATAGDSVVVTIVDGRTAKADITLSTRTAATTRPSSSSSSKPDSLQNLTAECLGITADVLDAGEITNIKSRLPHAAHQDVDAGFPVRVTVEPPASVRPHVPEPVRRDVRDRRSRLHAGRSVSPGQGAARRTVFQYVTGTVTSGSVRSRGRTGGFSEFVIIRPTRRRSTPPTARANTPLLAARRRGDEPDRAARRSRSTSRSAAPRTRPRNSGDAITLLANFDQHCVEYAGASLPNVWRSARDLTTSKAISSATPIRCAS